MDGGGEDGGGAGNLAPPPLLFLPATFILSRPLLSSDPHPSSRRYVFSPSFLYSSLPFTLSHFPYFLLPSSSSPPPSSSLPVVPP